MNPVDYSTWENLLQRVYNYKHQWIRDVQHLKDDMSCSFVVIVKS